MSDPVQHLYSDGNSSSALPAELVGHRMAALLHDSTPAQRLKIAFGLWQFTRSTLRRRLATNHPDWTHGQVCREGARRMLHDT